MAVDDEEKEKKKEMISTQLMIWQVLYERSLRWTRSRNGQLKRLDSSLRNSVLKTVKSLIGPMSLLFNTD